MWVKVCPPSKWVGPDPKPGETQLPVVLYHTWPSYPVSPSPTVAPPFRQSWESRTDARPFHSCHATQTDPPAPTNSSLNIMKRLWSLAVGAVGRASWVFCGVSCSCGGSEWTIFRWTRRQSLLLQPRQVPGVGSRRASLRHTSHRSLYIWTCFF